MAAAAAVSSPFSSQERGLPLRTGRLNNDPFSPPPSGQAQNNENARKFGGLTGLQDIADFDRENPYQFAAGSGSGSDLKLIPLKRKATTEHTEKFQHLCDQHQIRPEYDFEQVWGQTFTAKVAFAGQTVEAPGHFPNKKQAKEAVAKLAIERLRKIKKSTRPNKRKNDNRSQSPVDKSENWIGVLHQNGQQAKRFQPSFQEFCTESDPKHFSCKVTLNGGPLEGFSVGIYPNKGDAKAAAAKQAVEWLRSEGLLNTPAKRQKSDSDGQHTGATQAFGAVNLEAEVPADSPSSVRQRAHELIASLGLCQPSFHPQQSPNAPSPSKDMAAYFIAEDVRKEPRLAGPQGQVERIYGSRKARDACCERLLVVLEGIRQSRLQ